LDGAEGVNLYEMEVEDGVGAPRWEASGLEAEQPDLGAVVLDTGELGQVEFEQEPDFLEVVWDMVEPVRVESGREVLQNRDHGKEEVGLAEYAVRVPPLDPELGA
jgi:hypothetical protein